MNIAFVEDNENLREAVSGYLELEGYTVFEFGLIRDATREMKNTHFNLFILDVMLPDGDGFFFAKRIKAERDAPIIFLTALTEESDRITGLELGADDYILKPFSSKELVLRVKGVLKRTALKAKEISDPLEYYYGDHSLQILQSQHKLLLDEVSVDLTAAEWSILEFLALKSPRVFSRTQLLEFCLDSMAEGSERTIDTHIKNMRKKLGKVDWITTVRGFGYRFEGTDQKS